MDIKVLVCDDDPMFRDLVCDMVRKEGYMPIETADGQQALDVFFYWRGYRSYYTRRHDARTGRMGKRLKSSGSIQKSQ